MKNAVFRVRCSCVAEDNWHKKYQIPMTYTENGRLTSQRFTQKALIGRWTDVYLLSWDLKSKETLEEQQYHFVNHISNKDCFIIDSLNRLWSRTWMIIVCSKGFHRKHVVFLEKEEIDTKIYVDSKYGAFLRFHSDRRRCGDF